MAFLLELKESFKKFYNRYNTYVVPASKFIIALICFIMINTSIGYMDKLKNPVFALLLSVICAFLPGGFTLIVLSAFILIQLYVIAPEFALLVLCVMLLMYLLYFRFAPKTGILLILTPLLFYIKIPYIIPVIAALTVGITGIVPVVCGIFMYYMINFASRYSTAISSMDADSAVQNITFIFNNILNNKELIITIVSFSIAILMIYLIKRLSVNYSWIIGIVAGCFTNAVILIVSFSLLSIKTNVLFVVIGTVLAIVIGLVLHLFIFSVDYTATEYVQFEDNDYYYYVKAVPKVSVTERDITVKKINSRDKGYIHTESFEEDQ